MRLSDTFNFPLRRINYHVTLRYWYCAAEPVYLPQKPCSKNYLYTENTAQLTQRMATAILGPPEHTLAIALL